MDTWDSVLLLKCFYFHGLWARRNRSLEIEAVPKNPGCTVTIVGPGNLILKFSTRQSQKQVT